MSKVGHLGFVFYLDYSGSTLDGGRGGWQRRGLANPGHLLNHRIEVR